MTSELKDFRKQTGTCTDTARQAKRAHNLLAALVDAHLARVITLATGCRLLRLQAHLGRITQDTFDSMCKRLARATNWGWEMIVPFEAMHATVSRDSFESQVARRAIDNAIKEL